LVSVFLFLARETRDRFAPHTIGTSAGKALLHLGEGSNEGVR
jgi:hypothetical protein